MVTSTIVTARVIWNTNPWHGPASLQYLDGDENPEWRHGEGCGKHQRHRAASVRSPDSPATASPAWQSHFYTNCPAKLVNLRRALLFQYYRSGPNHRRNFHDEMTRSLHFRKSSCVPHWSAALGLELEGSWVLRLSPTELLGRAVPAVLAAFVQKYTSMYVHRLNRLHLLASV